MPHDDIMKMSDAEIIASATPAEIEAANAARRRAFSLFDKDAALLDRSLAILHRMATENTGWRGWFRRWYFADEPLRNDAANLVREAGFGMPQPINTRLVGDQR